MKSGPAVLRFAVDDWDLRRTAPSRLRGMDGAEADGAVSVWGDTERANEGGSEVVGVGVRQLIFFPPRFLRGSGVRWVSQPSVKPSAATRILGLRRRRCVRWSRSLLWPWLAIGIAAAAVAAVGTSRGTGRVAMLSIGNIGARWAAPCPHTQRAAALTGVLGL